MAEHPFKRPLTAAQIDARAKATATRAERSLAASKKKAALNWRPPDISEKEKRLRLAPRLVSGKLVMPDGRLAIVRLDPQTDSYVARTSYGGYEILDREFRPQGWASWEAAQRAGFRKREVMLPGMREKIARAVKEMREMETAR